VAIQRSGNQPTKFAYRTLYTAQMAERVGLIRGGIEASQAKAWLDMPALATGVVVEALDPPVATFNREVKANERLSEAESERVVGFARLVGIDFGVAWLVGGTAAVMAVPSVIAPEEFNVLVDPSHPDVAGAAARKVRKWTYSPRLLKP
jgi:hypothetical protein